MSSFGGESRHVVDFLVDEVLDAHDPATKALMLRSSILERLSGPLCDAVLEQEGSAELLDALARANLFLMPLDDRGEWYRFHHLFAQLLRVELEHRDPGLAPTLHRRAFAWHRDHGSVDEAIEHALEAGQFAEAGELIAAAWVDYVNVGRHATVLAWLERFPREMLSEDAQLQLVAAWVLSVCGKREAAAEAIAAVERFGNLDTGPLPDGFSSLEASLATLRARSPGATSAPESRVATVRSSSKGPSRRGDRRLRRPRHVPLRERRPRRGRSLARRSSELAPRDGQWRAAARRSRYRSYIAGDWAGSVSRCGSANRP